MARLAATIAADCAPEEDTPKLDLAAVAVAEGDKNRGRQVIRGLLGQRDADGPIDLASRTDELSESSRWSDQTRTG